MKIKPLTQLREMIAAALPSETNLSKTFRTFFIEAMELFLTIPNRINFLQMGRFGHSSEQRFRMNFRKRFDWLSFNRVFIQQNGNRCRRAIAIDPSYISKSGKKTPGAGYFWSGCASAVKWGLELMGFALVDADAGTGVHLVAKQTFTDRIRGKVPYYLKHMDDHNTITGIYLRTIHSVKDELLKISDCLVADAFFSKETFVTGAKALGFDVISRLRDDVRLKYLYTGPKTGKRGRPQKFTGNVNLKSLDESVFTTKTLEGVTLHSAVVWAVSLKREVKVVIADFIDSDKKTQARKIFFCTDKCRDAVDIFDIYRTRFQIEFLYRDAKQFTGLCNCQSRDVGSLDFAFNMSLSAINIARQFGKEYDVNLSVSDVKMVLHNAAMVERLFSTFGKSPNLMKNDTDFKELLFYGVRAVA
ncbi:MAG: transposase [Candidatus Cryptobacteroides sp.]